MYELIDIGQENIETNRCSICLELLDNGVVSRLKCKHEFHEKCKNDWLKVQNTCPICRNSIYDVENQNIQLISSENNNNNYIYDIAIIFIFLMILYIFIGFYNIFINHQ